MFNKEELLKNPKIKMRYVDERYSDEVKETTLTFCNTRELSGQYGVKANSFTAFLFKNEKDEYVLLSDNSTFFKGDRQYYLQLSSCFYDGRSYIKEETWCATGGFAVCQL